jgi:L-lactate permease
MFVLALLTLLSPVWELDVVDEMLFVHVLVVVVVALGVVSLVSALGSTLGSTLASIFGSTFGLLSSLGTLDSDSFGCRATPLVWFEGEDFDGPP